MKDNTVIAQDLDNDPLTYQVISGNTDGVFAISSSGLSTVSNFDELDFEVNPLPDGVYIVTNGN